MTFTKRFNKQMKECSNHAWNYALRSKRTSISLPLILMPFIILQAFSADSGDSNLTVPQPFDLPFSIFISANITWPHWLNFSFSFCQVKSKGRFLTNIWLPLEPNLSLIPLPMGPDKKPRSTSMLLSSMAPIPGPILSKLELMRSSPIPRPPVTLLMPPILPPAVWTRAGGLGSFKFF